MVVGIDFDGTCVKHAYPEVGEEIGAARWLKHFTNQGHKLVLFTMRDKKELQDAVDWFSKHDIPLYGVQVNPTQKRWTTSPKAYAQLYIDDAALGAPLINYGDGERDHVDWSVAGPMACEVMGIEEY